MATARCQRRYVNENVWYGETVEEMNKLVGNNNVGVKKSQKMRSHN
jgi:hypothetical protein